MLNSNTAKFDDKDFKTIIARRDKRFDGRFYFGVKTTKIYCRPTCPARPKPENILIFRSPSEAEANGYRACLRCRPDAAPGSKLLDGTMNTVSRALRFMQRTAGDELNIETLAAALGVTSRHLRRLFDEHLGASPIDILTTQRLHFAKQLVLETNIPMTEVGLVAGFGSVRRFNEAFKARYHQAPSAWRRIQNPETSDIMHLKVPVHLPYDFASVLAYLDRHAAYGVERVNDGIYQRFVPLDKTFGLVTVTSTAKQSALHVQLKNIPLDKVRFVLTRIRFLFDADHNPEHLPNDKGLSAQGIRVPGCFDPFEVAVSIILSQLVSTQSAKTSLKKLILGYGTPLGIDESGPVYKFPNPTALVHAKLETSIGLNRTRAEAIRGLAQEVDAGSIDFQSCEDFSVTYKKLLAIKGIGPWTASMIAMRCLGDPDAFPASDLIVQRALEHKLVEVEAWSACRAYLVHCLWRDYGESLVKVKKGKKA